MSGAGFSIYDMTAYAAVPDLYETYDLNRDDSCQELGILLAGKDARAEAVGIAAESQERRRLSTVYAVLSSPDKRRRYDNAANAGDSPTWKQLEYLSNFGSWPPPEASYYDAQQEKAQSNQVRNPAGTPARPYVEAGPGPAYNPYQPNMAAANVPAQYQGQYMAPMPNSPRRPSAGTRLAMHLLDVVFLNAIAIIPFGSIVSMTNGGWLETVLPASFYTLAFILYFVLSDTFLGGTPAKLMCGYRVRDRETRQKLSLVQSLKRNWIRAVTIIPFIGYPVGFIGSVVSLMTISPRNRLTGAHDDLANAEVVKRQQQ